jgi:hypothetical protein
MKIKIKVQGQKEKITKTKTNIIKKIKNKERFKAFTIPTSFFSLKKYAVLTFQIEDLQDI